MKISKIKNHWKEICIGVLVLFSLNKCTQSCSRQNKFEKAQIENDSLKTVLDSQTKVINDLCKDTSNYITQIKLYTNFEVKRNIQDSINNENLQNQKRQTDELIRENKRLFNTSRK